jgi:hypothetical protein
MKAGNHDDALLEDAIVQRIRKAGQEEPSCIAMQDCGTLRMPLQCQDASPKLGQELASQALALLLVPVVGVFDVRSSGWTEENRLHAVPFWIRARTSSQGMPVGPSCSRSSSRRSSSARWASVNGTAAGFLLRLSQSSSRRLRRSSVESASRSIAGLTIGRSLPRIERSHQVGSISMTDANRSLMSSEAQAQSRRTSARRGALHAATRTSRRTASDVSRPCWHVRRGPT